jgi:hypothetical protein
MAIIVILPVGRKIPKMNETEKSRWSSIINDFLGETGQQVFCLNLGVIEIRAKRTLLFIELICVSCLLRTI